ncbi:Tetratricopeptide repeat protein 21B, partial [Cladochytrium tenue]
MRDIDWRHQPEEKIVNLMANPFKAAASASASAAAGSSRGPPLPTPLVNLHMSPDAQLRQLMQSPSPTSATGTPAASSNDLDLSTILYYSRRSMYHSMGRWAEKGLSRRVSDPVLLFWKAVSVMYTGRPTESLRELQALQEKRELVLACPLAMELEAKLTITSSGANISDRASLHAAIFLWSVDSHDQARQYLKKIIDSSPNGGRSSTIDAMSSTLSVASSTASSPAGFANIVNAALAMMGWVDLTCGQENLVARSLTWFDRVLENNPRDLDALMGRLQFLRTLRKQHTPALDITAQIIAYHPGFIPAYIERVYVLLEMAAWEQVMEASQRLSSLSPDNIDSAAILIIQKAEPTNAQLFFELAQPVVRLAFRKDMYVLLAQLNITYGVSGSILSQADQLVAKAIELDSSCSEYKSEMGLIKLLQGKIDLAVEYYRAAASQNSQDLPALQGLIKCCIYQGKFEEAEEQLEFFDAVQAN